jgi:hypothetical protein
MNQAVLNFFRQNYAPGRICIIGSSTPMYKLIRNSQSGLTKDGKSSRYNHTFLMGNVRDDGRDDGSIYIYESDLHVSVPDWEIKNGVMESRITKWCLDGLEYAAVLGVDLTQQETESILRKALWYSFDEHHLSYPVGSLFGTLWAIIAGQISRKNIFNSADAVQCATFVRLCYQSINRDIMATSTDLSNTSPEGISQSQVFTFRKEWKKV